MQRRGLEPADGHAVRERSTGPAVPRQAASRRAFCCGSGAFALCCLPALRAAAERLRDGPLQMREVAPGIHVSEGLHAEVARDNLGAVANVGVIVGRERAAVIDSGACLLWGRRLREAVGRITDRPVSHVVLTHMHPDHAFGAAAFLADAPAFLGHANLPRALATRGDYYLRRLREALGDLANGSAVVQPTTVIADRGTIDLGGRVLELRAHRTAHTDNDLSLYDPQTRTLWAGDLVFMERVPALDGSLLGWLAVLDEIEAMPAEHVVPGHGPALAPWPAALEPERRYLTMLRDEIRRVQRGGGTMEQAIAEVGQSERGRWRLFDDYHQRNVTAAYAELEWE
jgi:quinoprotein relay system zinc metallohydrolase 2